MLNVMRPREPSLELCVLKPHKSTPFVVAGFVKVRKPEPFRVTMHESGFRDPSNTPPTTWLLITVMVNVVVLAPTPELVAPAPTANTAASPSVKTTGLACPLSAGIPAAPLVFLLHERLSQKPASGAFV